MSSVCRWNMDRKNECRNGRRLFVSLNTAARATASTFSVHAKLTHLLSCVSSAASPITWTLIALLILIAAFVSWVVYRRRARLFQNQQLHVLQEIRTVLESPPPPPPAMSPSVATSAAAGPSSLASTPTTAGEAPSATIPQPPPNTAQIETSVHLSPMPLQPDGVMLHAPRIEPATAVGRTTAPTSAVPHSPGSNSRSPSASPSLLQMPHFNATHNSSSPSLQSEEFVVISPAPATAAVGHAQGSNSKSEEKED
jgi:hypothetical protein